MSNPVNYFSTVMLAIGLAVIGLSCARPKPTETIVSRRAQFVGSTPEERADRQTRQLFRQLALSTKQTATVAAINPGRCNPSSTGVNAVGEVFSAFGNSIRRKNRS